MRESKNLKYPTSEDWKHYIGSKKLNLLMKIGMIFMQFLPKDSLKTVFPNSNL
jgi:hypothetical protein